MKHLIGSVILILIAGADLSHAEDLLQISSPFITQLNQTAISYGDPVVDRLARYKQSINKTAYETTLKLCEGYRRAHNLGPHPSHGQWMYTLPQATHAWIKVAREGALQPLSALGGLKADYLTLQNVGFFDFESWFGSMYTFYLVNSLGFLGGAMHCLNTMDQSDINYLAATILAVDYEMSLTTHVGLTWTAGEVLNLIVKATRFVWRPGSYLIRTAQARIGTTPLRVAGLTLGYVLADNLMVYLRERERSAETIQTLLSGESTLNNDLQKRTRFLMLNRTFEIALRLSTQEKSLRASGQAVNEDALYKPLYTYLGQTVGLEKIHLMREDLSKLLAQPRLSETEDAYKQLLQAFLPLIEELISNNKI